MSYDPEKQYRCTIIRGKAKSDLDNLLPAYARIISDIGVCEKDVFSKSFNERLGEMLGGATKKTLDNHRTEIAGKLFGMFYVNKENLVCLSERAEKFLDSGDQPQFFKDICFKFQQPSGMDSIKKIKDKIAAGIHIKPYHLILSLLYEARKQKIIMAKDEIAYYGLNSLDVLQGSTGLDMVIDEIVHNREQKDFRKVQTPGKESSYDMQHITEQLNLLELANLILIDEKSNVHLNENERAAIDVFINDDFSRLEFDFEKFNLEDKDSVKEMYFSWGKYYSTTSDYYSTVFQTSSAQLRPSVSYKGETIPVSGTSTIILGDEGERFVYEHEIDKVSKFNKRLVNKVKMVGKTKGLGYDVLSIIAESGSEAEFAKYIEVKSTKRVTAPNIDDDTWQDSIGMTRNEVTAARQHGNYFFIYRVYFTREGVIMFVMRNPYDKAEKDVAFLAPTQYRMEFTSKAVDVEIKSYE